MSITKDCKIEFTKRLNGLGLACSFENGLTVMDGLLSFNIAINDMENNDLIKKLDPKNPNKESNSLEEMLTYYKKGELSWHDVASYNASACDVIGYVKESYQYSKYKLIEILQIMLEDCGLAKDLAEDVYNLEYINTSARLYKNMYITPYMLESCLTNAIHNIIKDKIIIDLKKVARTEFKRMIEEKASKQVKSKLINIKKQAVKKSSIDLDEVKAKVKSEEKRLAKQLGYKSIKELISQLSSDVWNKNNKLLLEVEKELI